MTVDLRIAATATPGQDTITFDLGVACSTPSAAGFSVTKNGVNEPVTIPTSFTGQATVNVSLNTGTVTLADVWGASLDNSGGELTRDSDGQAVASKTGLSVGLVADFRELSPATGVTLADLGLDDFLAVIDFPGDSRWTLRTTAGGVTGFADASALGSERSDIFALATGTFNSYVNATGKLVRLRWPVIFEKGTTDGKATAYSGRLWGGTDRTSFQHGTTLLDNAGDYISFTNTTLRFASATNAQFKWGTVHYVDYYCNFNGVTYDVWVHLDGYCVKQASGLTQLNARNLCTKLNWWDLYDGGTVHWQQMLGVRVDAWLTGGAANIEGIDQSPNGVFGLPSWGEADSVCTLHNAFEQSSDQDTVFDWLALDAGTISLTNEHAAYDPTWLYANMYRYTGGSAGASTPVPIRRHARPRGTLPSGVQVCGLKFPIDTINNNGVDLRFFDDDGNKELGVRIDAGTGDTTLKILYDDSGWTEVDTGITIARDHMYCVRLSCAAGKPLGVSVSDFDNPGSNAAHGESVTVTEWTGLPALAGTGEIVLSDNSGATTLDFMGPQWGVLADQWESSYTSSGVPNTPANVARSARRSYGSDGGRGAASSGFTVSARPAGPFNAMGRGGGTVRDMIDDYIGGEGSAWFANNLAFPAHIIDGTVNRIAKNIERDVSQAAAEAHWVDHGEENIAQLKADELELVGLMQAGGCTFMFGATATPPIFMDVPGATGWLQEMADAHHGVNEWRRANNLAGRYSGGYVFDMADYYGTEAAATLAAFENDDVHPGDGNSSGRSDDYSEGVYGSVGLGVLSTGRSRNRGRGR